MSDLADRIPPHSEPAEMAVLGAMMIDPNASYDVVQVLELDHFYKPHHATIYRAILGLVEQRSAVDVLTVRDALRATGKLDEIGGVAYLAQLIDNVPSAASAGDYARIIREKAKLRYLGEAAARIQKLVHDPTATTDEKVKQAEEMVYRLKSSDRLDFFQPLSVHSEAFFNDIERLMNDEEEVAGLTTGYTDLDDKTTGFSEGDLVILAARPAMGKTGLVLNWGVNIARQRKGAVAFFSLEMGGDQLVRRMMSMMAGVPMDAMRRKGLDRNDYDRLLNAAETLYSLPIYIDDTANLSTMDMGARCRRLILDMERQHDPTDPLAPPPKLAMIVVDYLQLMRANRSVDNRVQEVGEIARGLKLLARELKVPVVALSQLSREVEKRPDKRPMLSDLRESGSIEAEADLVAFIYRKKYYDRGGGDDPNPFDTEVAEIDIAKHRNGATGTVLLGFQPAFIKFVLLDKDSKTDYWQSLKVSLDD